MTDAGSDEIRDRGYDDWMDALDAGEGYLLRCANGHGSLPPRWVCPDCGSGELTEEALPAGGELVTHTVIHVGTQGFDAQAPYTVGIAQVGDVRITGLVRGVDPEDVEVGATVEPSVGENPQTGDRVVVFRPR
ncbi:MAG: Zn-ribbon domain-containing OB-fold protein [Haloferacaceae archaeon]